MSDRQTQLKEERERRQARIRAAGANRLAKITGVAGTQDFKKPVSVHQSPAPSPKPAKPSDRGLTEAEPSKAVASESKLETKPTNKPGSSNVDPLTALLQAAGGNGDFDFSALASALGQEPPSPQQQQQAQQQVQQQQQQRSPQIDLAFEFIHMVSAVLLGLYAALGNPWNTTLVFISVQLAQIAAQAAFGHISTGLPSYAVPFIAMLPRQRQRQLNAVGALIGAARNAYRDFAIALVMFGAISLGGRDFKRPI